MNSADKHLTDTSRELNRTYWARVWRQSVEDFTYQKSARTLQEEFEQYQSLSALADSYTRAAFFLLASGHSVAASQAAERAIFVAQEALRLERFELLYKAEFRNTSPYREIEKAYGQAQALTALHYGIWFSTGVRPLEHLKQAAQYRLERYNLQKQLKCENLESVLMAFVEAELFDEALFLFRREFKGKTELSQSARFSRSRERTLAVVAEYAAGNTEIKEVSRKAIESWFQKSSSWYVVKSGMPWWERLSWAWLRGRHFTGVTELKSILEELRGY